MHKEIKIKYPTAKNLQNIDMPLYKIIFFYGIDHTFLASQIYRDEWNKDDPEVKKQLTGKLRNKLDGRGKLTVKEYTDLINTVAKLGESIQETITKSKEIRSKMRKEKIADLLESLDEDTLDQLKKEL